MLVRLALLAALLCACTTVQITYVRWQKGVDGAWDATYKGRVSRLDATGEVATLVLNERTFVFADMVECHGWIATDKAQLNYGRTTIRIDQSFLWVRTPDGNCKHALAEVPKGGRVHYSHGKFWVE